MWLLFYVRDYLLVYPLLVLIDRKFLIKQGLLISDCLCIKHSFSVDLTYEWFYSIAIYLLHVPYSLIFYSEMTFSFFSKYFLRSIMLFLNFSSTYLCYSFIALHHFLNVF